MLYDKGTLKLDQNDKAIRTLKGRCNAVVHEFRAMRSWIVPEGQEDDKNVSVNKLANKLNEIGHRRKHELPRLQEKWCNCVAIVLVKGIYEYATGRNVFRILYPGLSPMLSLYAVLDFETMNLGWVMCRSIH